MIRHVVSWKLAAEDAATKLEQSAQIAAKLDALVPLVPQIRSLRVGSNVVDVDRNWDVVLIADYDDADALQAYQEHPEHLRAAAYIRSVAAELSCVDFIV
ncbi:MAG: Dabb family protein [Lacisediminihabitans sp.]